MEVGQSKTDYNSTCGHTVIWVACFYQKELKASAFLVKLNAPGTKARLQSADGTQSLVCLWQIHYTGQEQSTEW